MRHASISKEMVKKTEAYKGLTPMLQKMVLKRNNMVRSVNHSYQVAKNIGLDKWKSITNARYYNVLIVEEILNKED